MQLCRCNIWPHLGGQTYEKSDALVSGALNVTTIPVSQGFDIAETEVLLLTFDCAIDRSYSPHANIVSNIPWLRNMVPEC
jgi:hypothetical protein